MGDEVLGRGQGGGGGGFGPGRSVSTATYLANCNGLNAAVKVYSFKGSRYEHGAAADDDTEADELRRRRRSGGGNGGCGFQNRTKGKEEEEMEQELQKVEAVGWSGEDDSRRRRATAAALVREVEALKRLRGPRIVTIYGAVSGGGGGGGIGSDSLGLAMELMPGGSLRQRLERSVSRGGDPARPLLPLDMKTVRGIVRDVVSGVAFLHAEAFVHGGLSSTNVLLDAKGRAKVGVFSLSTLSRPRVVAFNNTP